MLNDLRYRLRAFFRRDSMDREMDAELRFHLEKEVEKHVAAGVAPDEAMRRARATFGGLEGTRQDTRDARGLVMLDNLLLDLRYAVRGLVARPVFTAGVVLTLALGIGANATIFGIVDRLLFRSPPGMRDQGSVHRLYTGYTESNGQRSLDRNHAFATYLDLQRTDRAIESVAAFQTRQLPVGEGEGTRELPVTVASASYFTFFDARPALGRFFTASEDQVPAGEPVAVLGHGFWQSAFGGRRDVVGESIRVGRDLVTIIGVAPEGFVGMGDQGVPAVYIPITHYAHSLRGPEYPGNYFWSWLEMIARRKPGATLAAAEAEMTATFTESWRRVLEVAPGIGSVDQAQPSVTLAPVQLERGPDAGRESAVARWLAGVALIVLLIACANVANLLLSRAVSRRREIAVRLALGVSRGRLIRQLLTESLVLAMAGGLAGLAIAHWGTAALRSLFFTTDEAVAVATDGRTLLFALLATLIVALLTGLAPALQSVRGDLAASIRSGAREGTYQRSRLRTALLGVQATLSVVLLVGAGLFVRSLRNVEQYRMGYDADRVVAVGMNLRGVELGPEEGRALVERMLVALEAMPGVTSATVAASVPFLTNETRGLHVPGVDSLSRRGMFLLQVGSPSYFATMGTRILRGRPFDETDRPGGPRVVVVSEGMARAIWQADDPIGKCLHVGGRAAPCSTVIGVAEEARVRSLLSPREFSYYLPAAQYADFSEPMLFARVDGEPAALADAIRRRLQREMPGAAYVLTTSLEALVDPQRRSWQFGATMFVAFGGLALVLAAVGLYSLIAYDVAQRTQELSVRLALGASAGDLMRLVVASGMRVVLVGLALGGGLALWGSRFMEDLMFRQSPRDPLVFGVVALVLLAVALVASVGPALRASRVDPNVALRGS
jgi:predicted permease